MTTLETTIANARPVLVTSWGGYGDTFPLYAIAERLKEAGENIVFAALQEFRSRLEQDNPFPYRIIEASMVDMFRALPESFSRPTQLVSTFGKLMRMCASALDVTLSTLHEAIVETRPYAALINSPSFLFAGPLFLHHNLPVSRIDPYIFINPPMGYLGILPETVPSSLPRWLRSPLFAPSIHRALELTLWYMIGRLSRRKAESLLGVRIRGGYAKLRRSERLTISGTSAALVVQNKHALPPGVHLPGLFYSNPIQGAVPENLQRFIDAQHANGKTVVGACFGTMVFSAAETTRIVVEALRDMALAGVLIGGFGELVDDPAIWQPGSDMHFVQEVDFARVLPLLDAFISHGGSGTTSHVLKAGLPFVGVIYLPDQWARVEIGQRYGTSVAPIPRNKLTKEALKAALQQILKPEVQHKARTLADQIQLDGIERATQLILDDLKKLKPVPQA